MYAPCILHVSPLKQDRLVPGACLQSLHPLAPSSNQAMMHDAPRLPFAPSCTLHSRAPKPLPRPSDMAIIWFLFFLTHLASDSLPCPATPVSSSVSWSLSYRGRPGGRAMVAHGTFIAVHVVLAALAAIFMGARVLAKRIKHLGWTLDDSLLLASMIVFSANSAWHMLTDSQVFLLTTSAGSIVCKSPPNAMLRPSI